MQAPHIAGSATLAKSNAITAHPTIRRKLIPLLYASPAPLDAHQPRWIVRWVSDKRLSSTGRPPSPTRTRVGFPDE
jgi:hypothetical protein